MRGVMWRWRNLRMEGLGRTTIVTWMRIRLAALLRWMAMMLTTWAGLCW